MTVPSDDELLFVALGGAGEIGMNLNLYGTAGKWLMVDLGIGFADSSMAGVEVVMPDPAFIVERRDALVGIVLTHALRAAALPLISYLGPGLAALLTGSLVVEQIFGLPGIGRYFVQGALNRDYTLVMGVVICYASLIIVLNFLADIAYAILDPRVRLK